MVPLRLPGQAEKRLSHIRVGRLELRPASPLLRIARAHRIDGHGHFFPSREIQEPGQPLQRTGCHYGVELDRQPALPGRPECPEDRCSGPGSPDQVISLAECVEAQDEHIGPGQVIDPLRHEEAVRGDKAGHAPVADPADECGQVGAKKGLAAAQAHPATAHAGQLIDDVQPIRGGQLLQPQLRVAAISARQVAAEGEMDDALGQSGPPADPARRYPQEQPDMGGNGHGVAPLIRRRPTSGS